MMTLDTSSAGSGRVSASSLNKASITVSSANYVDAFTSSASCILKMASTSARTPTNSIQMVEKSLEGLVVIGPLTQTRPDNCELPGCGAIST